MKVSLFISADNKEILCSGERPPNKMATLIFFLGIFLHYLDLQSLTYYNYYYVLLLLISTFLCG